MGSQLPKKLIPVEYKTKYGLTNQFRVVFQHFWRMLLHLTAESSDIASIRLVLDTINRKKYDKNLHTKNKSKLIALF